MTADNFVIQPGGVVAVQVATPSPWVQVTVVPPPTAAVVTVAGPQGPAGASGAAGPAYSSPAWFFDEGPPGTIIGSKPGDFYLDVSDGTVYVLGGN
jgi:hypothetical protein